jgi:hypothetical protein
LTYGRDGLESGRVARVVTSWATSASTAASTPPRSSVTEEVPTLTTTLRLVIIVVDAVEATVSRESFPASSAMVLAAVQARAHFVAPPLKGQRANGHDVTVAHARSREKTIDTQIL